MKPAHGVSTYDDVGSTHRAECAAGRVVALDETARTVRHVISTARLDRANRMVEPSGWKLSSFRENPVVLANHDYDIQNIIGRASDTRVDGDALVSTTEFAKEGLGNVAFRLVQAGLARTWSVAWKGMRGHRIGELDDCARCQAAGKVDYGVHFTQQELLEYSLVAIPANPDAVMGLQAAGLASRDEIDAWLAMKTAAAEPKAAPDPPKESQETFAVPDRTALLAHVHRMEQGFQRRNAVLRVAQRNRS